MINQKNIKNIIFSIIILTTASYGYGMDEPDFMPRGYGYGGMMSGGYDRETSRLLGKISLADRVAKYLNDQDRKLQTLKKDRAAAADAGRNTTNIDREIGYNERYAEMLRDRQESLMKPTSMGMLVARGLAGKDSSVLDDYNIDGILDGIGKGFLVRAARATGDVFSKKVAGTVQVVLGGTWDTIFGWVIDFWVDANSVVFHGSASAFKGEELASWKLFIKGILDDIGAILKDGTVATMRGHDMTLRQFDVVGADKDETKEEKEIKITIWNYLMQGYAKQFERLVDEFEKRKQYYKEDSLEVFYSGQIQGRLLELKDLLLKAATLSELNSQLDSNRLVVVAIKNNIVSMFDRLNDLIKPRTLSLDEKSVSADDRGLRNRRTGYSEEDDDMPHRMSGY